MRSSRSVTLPVLAAVAAALALVALPWSDWTNTGGSTERNGLADVAGPDGANLVWRRAPWAALHSSPPFVLDGRVFVVRQTSAPSGKLPGDTLYALDLDTGAIQWSTTLPYSGDPKREGPAWIAGASHGRVIASRSQAGMPQPLMAFDAASGARLWTSPVSTQSSRHDGALFLANGDVVVADALQIQRLRGSNGARVWSVVRSYGQNGVYGGAASPSGLFFERAIDASGRMKLCKLDPASGLPLYESAAYAGGADASGSSVSPDGRTVYVSTKSNVPSEHWLYCFEDTGSALLQRWRHATKAMTYGEKGVAPDGSIYTLAPDDALVRYDRVDGSELARTGPLPNLNANGVAPSVVLDTAGHVYLSNGMSNAVANYGRLWAFSADLSHNPFTLTLERPGPSSAALAEGGTLVVADVRGLFAYRDPTPPPPATYCTSGKTSSGCNPAMSWTGSASASAGTGFVLTATSVEGDKAGLVFYGTAGRALAPWDPSRDQYLCVKSPLQRTPLQTGGGEAGTCEGELALDWSLYVAEHPGALGCPFAVGARVNAQAWFRDPATAKTTAVSNAIEFYVEP